ncbi:hypothetical protein IKR20_04160 [bacterium]|nr:hypothetical protein [bacterium]
MRKKIAAILVLVSVFAFFACSKKEEGGPVKAEPAPVEKRSVSEEEEAAKAEEKRKVVDITEGGEELFSHFITLEKPADKLVSDLVEVYNCSVFATGLGSINANWMRAGNSKAALEALNFAKSRTNILKDKEMKALLDAAVDEYEKYLSGTKTPDPGVEKKGGPDDLKAVAAFYEKLSEKYSPGNFVKLKPEEFIKSKDLKRFKDELEPLAKDPAKLSKKAAAEKDFNKKSLYALLLISLSGFNSRDAVFEEIFKSHKYSPYTQKLWNLWRGVEQAQFDGVSSNSIIENGRYNSMRREVALGILEELKRDPGNEFAVIDFIMTATADNILRTGAFNSADGGTTSVPDFGFELPVPEL